MHQIICKMMMLCLAVSMIAGCNQDYESDVDAIEGAFPLLSELQVEYVRLDGHHLLECRYIAYARGVFISDLRCPVGGAPDGQLLDAQAHGDMLRLADATMSRGRSLASASVEYGTTGAPTWGEFRYESGTTYVYVPGWRDLPADGDGVAFRVISEDWILETR